MKGLSIYVAIRLVVIAAKTLMGSRELREKKKQAALKRGVPRAFLCVLSVYSVFSVRHFLCFKKICRTEVWRSQGGSRGPGTSR